MSYTNKTPNYDLPQYAGSDLAEWNDNTTAYAKIDTALANNKSEINSTKGRVDLLENWKTTTSANLSQMSGDLAIAKATAENANTKVDNLEVEFEAETARVGDLATLLTEDKTSIVGAINSLYQMLVNE